MKCLFCKSSIKENFSFYNIFKNNNNSFCKTCKSYFSLKKERIEGINHFYFSDYDRIKEIIYKIKYLGDVEKIEIFKPLIKNFFEKYNFSIIAPCPTNYTRLSIRGFNHVELILDICNIKYQKIFYQKYREKRATLHKKRKYDEVFILNEKKKLIKESDNILVIDDILTSGKTLLSLYKTIKKENNNIDVTFLTIAKTSLKERLK